MWQLIAVDRYPTDLAICMHYPPETRPVLYELVLLKVSELQITSYIPLKKYNLIIFPINLGIVLKLQIKN